MQDCYHHCALRNIFDLDGEGPLALSRLEGGIIQSRILRKGEALYYKGHMAKRIFIVRTGTIKALAKCGDSREQIVSIFQMGAIAGLDGMHTGTYKFDAIATEISSVCAVSSSVLTKPEPEYKRIASHLHMLISGQSIEGAAQKLMVTLFPTDLRVVVYLLNLIKLNERAGLFANEFDLHMSHIELANYLGTSAETVSRVLARLTKDGAIEMLERKKMKVIDRDKLEKILNKKGVLGD